VVNSARTGYLATAAFSLSAASPNLPVRPSMLLLSVDLAPPGTCLNTGDSFKSKTGLDNKRHTNAHQPLSSHSPTGISIPLSATAKIISKHAAICALLLLVSAVTLFVFIVL
jgi:hypothetical protein